MQALTLDRAKAIYRQAVDAQASDAEGAAWWAEVHAEIGQVLAARTTVEAAQVIAWWHHDWSAVGDSAKSAAQRIRAAARAARALNGKETMLKFIPRSAAAAILAAAPALAWAGSWTIRCAEGTASEFRNIATGAMTVLFNEPEMLLTFKRTQPNGEINQEDFPVARAKILNTSYSFTVSVELKPLGDATVKPTYLFDLSKFDEEKRLSMERAEVDEEGFYIGGSKPMSGKRCAVLR